MERKSNALLLIPEWALTFAGLVYSTGFLTVFTFLERFGLKEAGSEFFKAKYMHVGILFSIFPMITLLPIAAMYFSQKAEKEFNGNAGVGKKHFSISLPSMLLVLNTLAVFYMLIIFAPPKYVIQKHFLLPALFGVTFSGLAFFHHVIPRIIKDDMAQKVHMFTRWFMLLGLAIPIDYYALWDFKDTLSEIFLNGGYNFILFITRIGYIMWRFSVRSTEFKSETGKVAFWILGGCIIFTLYYLSILTFAYRIYPYMPASKGGGDYTYAVTAEFYLKDMFKKSIPKELLSDTSDIKTKPLK